MGNAGTSQSFLWGAICAAALLASPVTAQNALDVEVRGTVKRGEKPAVILIVNQPLRAVNLRLEGKGAGAPEKPIQLGKTNLRPKKRVTFPLPAQTRAETIHWSGALDVVFHNGSEGSLPLTFSTQAFSTIQLTMTRADLQLEKHQMTFRADQQIRTVTVLVTGDDGEDIASLEKTLDTHEAGAPITVSWTPQTASPVLRIRVNVIDTAGFHQQVDYYPWQIHIPHEEVLFPSGQAQILPEEEPKLEAVLPLIEETQKRYGKAIEMTGETMKLFIIGHTDTVGRKRSNVALSRQRAAAIASWFRGRGVRMGIYYRGFGESRPKVSTPDETPEAQNRRVDYTVALQSPTDSLRGWTHVPSSK